MLPWNAAEIRPANFWPWNVYRSVASHLKRFGCGTLTDVQMRPREILLPAEDSGAVFRQPNWYISSQNELEILC